MYALVLILHLLVCIALVGVVLVQSGKGGGLAGGAFGGSAQTVFGGRGATDFVTRATMILGAIFFVSSIALALMSSGVAARRSLIQQQARRPAANAQPQQAPGTAPSTAPQSAPATGTPAGGTPPPPATGTPGGK